MKEITYTDFESGDISFLADLCNALMSFQAKKATIKPEVMSAMNFENRLIPDFQTANGNESVGTFYEKIGFTFSHSVFDGFIQAYTEKPR
ncbi:hypothetical protein [Sediminispirochaeta smaragdinae]|uniref:hypothetical protein n=1 Tax=Sediminispirochaeta smaragdinae TaxID=55206 RepID=UPI0002EF1008|nr:hypothetical protein [Sediminispirochaeta smaragdinae]